MNTLALRDASPAKLSAIAGGVAAFIGVLIFLRKLVH